MVGETLEVGDLVKIKNLRRALNKLLIQLIYPERVALDLLSDGIWVGSRLD